MSEAAPLADTLKGHCLCGAVTITVEAPHKELDICHCKMCARWGGAMYAGLEVDSFSIGGEASISVYQSSDWAERAFCSKCGSNLWYKFLPTGNRTFLAGLFDLPEGIEIKQQIFVDEKPDWYDLVQKSPMKTGPEIIAEAEAAGFKFD
ncbi:MAG: GFA family protein [Pseudomonadota bacterium]